MISELSTEGVHEDELKWFKSSYSSNSSEADCVEAASAPGGIRLRDSKNTSGPHLRFAPTAWNAFVAHTSKH
ncbi:DUF397 domain-containing protein [Streptomyces sp. NPDC058330]|uniref:DUF397 domain-containing protein n=1 Tax=Streptomyces sp. NPDC058330 TaxID=3346449 RepID=UPI0036E68322